MTIAQYCNRALSPLPSMGVNGVATGLPGRITPIMSNGLATKLFTSKKNVVTMEMTPTT